MKALFLLALILMGCPSDPDPEIAYGYYPLCDSEMPLETVNNPDCHVECPLVDTCPGIALPVVCKDMNGPSTYPSEDGFGWDGCEFAHVNGHWCCNPYR